MKDSAGRVIYVGKAKNLRSRAGSYFLKAAEQDADALGLGDWRHRLRGLRERVDALLMEAADQGHPAETQPRVEG
jgi:excinuclease ABC subunit C